MFDNDKKFSFVFVYFPELFAVFGQINLNNNMT